VYHSSGNIILIMSSSRKGGNHESSIIIDQVSQYQVRCQCTVSSIMVPSQVLEYQVYDIFQSSK